MLLDTYLPQYQFQERHARDIAATPAVVMAAVRDFRPEADPFFRQMIGLRELPGRLLARLRLSGRPATPPFGLDNFTLLAEEDETERVYGLVGAFWQLDYGLVPIQDGAAFLAHDNPDHARLALNFLAQPTATGGTRLFTETRVFCPTPTTQRRFAPYWYVIRPVSGLIRQRILGNIARSATQIR